MTTFGNSARWLPFTVLLLYCLTGCASRDPLAVIDRNTAPMPFWLIYEGSLPCADCSEIKTRLELKIDYSDPEPPYILKQAYLGKQDEDQVFVTHGKYGTLKWEHRGEDATVYELDPGKEGQQVYFLRVHADTLVMLNRKMQRIDSGLDYFLVNTGRRE